MDLNQVRDVGSGRTVYLVIQTGDTAATSGGAATAAFTLASDAQAAIAVDGSATVHVLVGPFAKATLAANTVLAVIAVPLEGTVYERYLGILQTTAVAAFTAGNISAFLTPDPRHWKAYADGVN
jgi:hypothetical protein